MSDLTRAYSVLLLSLLTVPFLAQCSVHSSVGYSNAYLSTQSLHRRPGTPLEGFWNGTHGTGALQEATPQAASKSPPLGGVPNSFSWNSYFGGANYMTPVKDQGSCGSCWAFASVGDMEAQYQINKGNPSTGIDLSEQNVLQCSGGSCSGWYLSNTLDFLENSGTPDEACNPYAATDHPCGTSRCSDYLSRTYNITGWTWISTDTANIKNWLYTHGPVMVWMPVFSDFPWYDANFWQYYFYGHSPSGSYGGHFVVIVGWDDQGSGTSDDYWIARNSWGTSGGDVNSGYGGYFYMTQDPTNGFFGIYQEAAIISDITVAIVFYSTPSSFVSASSPGSTAACGGTFTNGQIGSCSSSFSATANLPSPSTGWQFDHWSWTGGVSCSSSSANPATCSASGGGSLTAVYAAQVTFVTNPSSTASIDWGSCSGPGYGNGQSIFSTSYGSVAACYVPSGYTLSSWSCSGGLACSGWNDPTLVTFNGPGTITLNLKTGSLTNPVSTSLTASASPANPVHGTSFTVSGTLTANGVGLGGEQIVLVFGWTSSIVTVTTQPDGSFSYIATAPATAGSYKIQAFFLGDLGGSTQYLPSTATATINVS